MVINSPSYSQISDCESFLSQDTGDNVSRAGTEFTNLRSQYPRRAKERQVSRKGSDYKSSSMKGGKSLKDYEIETELETFEPKQDV